MTAAVRVLSGLGGVFVLLCSALFTLGTSLAAPLAMLAARRLAQRSGRSFTPFRSWLSAATGSSIAVLLAFIIGIALIPPNTFREVWDTAQVPDTATLPEWITRIFPQAARPDPVTREIVNSSAFTMFFGILGLLIGCVFLGAISGSAGWLGTTLLAHALRGRRAA